ncbi:MAG: hypothetical protein ACQERC_11190 [Bacteroidota bacterium]
MKKVVILIIAVVLAFLLGHYVGRDQLSESQRANPEKVYVDRIKEKIIRDTLRIEKPVYIDQSAKDTASTRNVQDSVSDPDTSHEEDTTALDPAIVEEELLARRTIILKWNPRDSSSVSELLNKNAQSFNREMIVEFWSNPLNLTGYELNRNKLKLFGFHPDETIRLEIKDDDRTLFLHSESLHLRLEKTEQFKSLQL